MRALDAYCGLCIVGLYFMYLGVVKGALSVFDCTMNKDGVYILDADPSIICNTVRGPPPVVNTNAHHLQAPRSQLVAYV